MLFLWGVLAVALATELPDDPAVYEQAAPRLLAGPRGCWELVGRATWNWQFGRFGESRGDALFAGRLDGGEWKGWYLQALGEVERRGAEGPRTVYRAENRFAPLVGRIQGGRGGVTNDNSVKPEKSAEASPSNILKEALAELGGGVSSVYTRLDGDDVILDESVPLDGSRSKDYSVQTRFPKGEPVPTAMDVVFPESFHLKAFPNPKVEGAGAQVRGRLVDGELVPTAEAFHMNVQALGFTISGAQTIQYTHAERCGAVKAEPKVP